MGIRIDRGRCAPCRTLADHPDDLARPRVPRRIEMLQAQRDRIAQRAREFVDEGFAREHVRVPNRVTGIGEFDRRLRVPVDERLGRAGIRALGLRTVRRVTIVRGRLRAIAQVVIRPSTAVRVSTSSDTCASACALPIGV